MQEPGLKFVSDQRRYDLLRITPRALPSSDNVCVTLLSDAHDSLF